MIFEHQHYRSYLKGVLAEKRSRNAAYSLRAFARDLGLDPSHLSAIYAGKKGLSLGKALEISQKLGLDPKETEYFCLMIQLDLAQIPGLERRLLESMKNLQGDAELVDVELDRFRIIADWYHLPILEMTHLDRFKFSATTVAKRLGITPIEAEVAIERLERVGLLKKDRRGKYQKVINQYIFRSAKPNAALRKYHAQMLEKAAQSLQTQTPAERHFTSQTISIDVAQLAAAKQKIEEFCRQMNDFFDQGKTRTQTYQLGIQLFNLTQTKGESS